MSQESPKQFLSQRFLSPVSLLPGTKIRHGEFGEGVITGSASSGYVTVFFRSIGEKQVGVETLFPATDTFDAIVESMQTVSPDALQRLLLMLEAYQLPLMESAATLTSAKVDLLPHQIVLVHHIANAKPKRFLVADEVGLGKTIETALILRELASRGELERAIMIVPAGLIDNWQRELNDVFNLDFEVFGSEGDVTDRRTNTFVTHNRLIASIDTLKRPARLKKLLAAPPWDLVVFDEAHHLTVTRMGGKVKKTENFRLAEAISVHCRDILFLSATPHQGDHFRFWMLINLLNSGLFENETDMVDNRYRLNAVVIRRTKADACAQDGSPLFLRRMVQTESFALTEKEKSFYNALLEYLRDGYNLATAQGNKGRALGFIMTVFQKIAASSFAAIRSTLRRRLLMLTVQEALRRDELLDIDGRNNAYDEAREYIRVIYNIPESIIGNAEIEQMLSDIKYKILKKSEAAYRFAENATDTDSEYQAEAGENAALLITTMMLPEERKRIKSLLTDFPVDIESKTLKLISALRQIWAQNSVEKIVIFATYLGTVDTIKQELDKAFPNAGVDILKGGDHGAKTAAQKRFKRKDGPKVLVCTAAGREGINLQVAHILFNYDLPWNPMDLEQRIGRIHRYGQESTAQVYNLVAADTIEGQIYLLLEAKLVEIATAVGKVDENGQVAEDLRTQVLGQLSGALSYDRLYQNAITDLAMQRTRQELEVAMSNANLARKVVFELFQDLEQFNIGDYKKFDDQGQGMRRLIAFLSASSKFLGWNFNQVSDTIFSLVRPGETAISFTKDRDTAVQNEQIQLIGLEHPIVKQITDRFIGGNVVPNKALYGKVDTLVGSGLLTYWSVNTVSKEGFNSNHIIKIGIDRKGNRAAWIESASESIGSMFPASTSFDIPTFAGKPTSADIPTSASTWKILAKENKSKLQEYLHRELIYKGLVGEGVSYSAVPIAMFAMEQTGERQ
jgi:SNF2 family DNA or RNA helicase